MTKQQDIQASKKVKFTYTNSKLFRVIHTDGVACALNPSGDITVSLYNQRFSVPKEVVFDINEDGELVGEGSIITQELENIDTTIIRETEVLAVMSLDAAQELLEQLHNIIEEHQNED